MESKNNSIKQIIKKVVLYLLIIVLCYTVLSIVAAHFVYTGIFNSIHEEYKICNYPYELVSQRYPRESVCFSSGKNTLRGYMYSPEQNADKMVIISCGINETADSHLAETMFFVDRGWVVMIYNATGIANSDGDSIIGLSQSRLDLLSAIDYAEKKLNIPIVLYGYSAGGYAAASVLDDSRVMGAVCISSFNSPVETMHYKAKEYTGILADIQTPFLKLEHWFVFGDDGFVDATDSINNSDKPIAIYYGKDDDVIPYPINLYSHKPEINNKKAVFRCDDETHMSFCLSDSAKKYVSEIENSNKASRKEKIDYDKANELDMVFMNEIEAFLKNACLL